MRSSTGRRRRQIGQYSLAPSESEMYSGSTAASSRTVRAACSTSPRFRIDPSRRSKPRMQAFLVAPPSLLPSTRRSACVSRSAISWTGQTGRPQEKEVPLRSPTYVDVPARSEGAVDRSRVIGEVFPVLELRRRDDNRRDGQVRGISDLLSQGQLGVEADPLDGRVEFEPFGGERDQVPGLFCKRSQT